MKFISKLKKNLILKYENYQNISLLINIPFTIGLAIFFIAGLFTVIVFNNINFALSIFIGFIIAFVFYIDMSLYISKHIKNLNPVLAIFNLIKNLLLTTFFFIITYKFIRYNFIGVSIGFTIMPFSILWAWIFWSDLLIK